MTDLAGRTIIDTALGRRGTILTVDAATLRVSVSFRPGQVVTLRPADIRAGRYQIVDPGQPHRAELAKGAMVANRP